MKKILIVSATMLEIEAVLKATRANRGQGGLWQTDREGLDFLITGVGSVATAFHLARLTDLTSYDVVVQAGIGGSFSARYPIGAVVSVYEDSFADLGAQDAGGSFIDVFDLGLLDPNELPFQHGRLQATIPEVAAQLPLVRGITVNKVHGELQAIEAIQRHYQPDVESMEGAAFFYACRQMGVSGFAQIRAISNRVEPRNRSAWNIPAAVSALNRAVQNLIQ